MNTAPVESALKRFSDLTAECAALAELVTCNAAHLANLEATCNLSDEAALSKIGRLQTMQALLPRRIQAREQGLADCEADILKATHTFISTEFSPHARKVLAAAEAATRKALAGVIEDDVAREMAVQKSKIVAEINGLTWPVSVTDAPREGVEAYARRVLTAAGKLAAMKF